MNAYLDDLDAILQNAFQHNVRAVTSIGIDVNSSIRAVELARKYPMVSATVGIHPHDVDNITDRTYPILADLVQKNKEHIVGYGEIGLDYVKLYSTPENQRKQFRNQLALADELRLPVIIHDRDAHEDTLMILREAGTASSLAASCTAFPVISNLHRKFLILDCYISIPGTVTFKNADLLQEVAGKIPLSSLLLETDGPFLAPHPIPRKKK